MSIWGRSGRERRKRNDGKLPPNCMKKVWFLQTRVPKGSLLEKIKENLQKLQKPLAFFAKVCYNVAREKTDVLRVGFPYDYFAFGELLMRYDQMSREALAAEYTAMKSAYEAFSAKGLKLDLSRGKPGAEQLDITTEMLDCLNASHSK